MDNKIQFELVSPEAKLASKAVKLAVMPGDLGEFGVGANHSALVSHLKVGVVKLYAENTNDKPERIFITGGFADITNEVCVVLAEEAIAVEKLDQAKLKKEHATLQENLKLAAEAADKARFQAQLDIVTAKLDAIAA